MASQRAQQGPQFDQALKKLLENAHDGFLALVAPEVRFARALSPELPASARVADLVWEVTFADAARVDAHAARGLLHIELQTAIDPTIGERVASYGLRLAVRELEAQRERGEAASIPLVRSMVVYLRPGATPPPEFTVPWLNGQRSIHCEFDVIKLWELSPDLVLQTQEYELWPLATLMAGATAATTIAVAQRLAHAPLPRAERSEILGLLVTLSRVRLRGDRALAERLRALVWEDTMLLELMEESNFGEFWEEVFGERYRQKMLAKGLAEGIEKGLAEGIEKGLAEGIEKGLAEGEAKGLAEGEAKGLAEGEAKGLAEGLRASLQFVLEGRFGALPEDVIAAITQAEAPALTAILRYAGVETLPQLRARLGLDA